MNEAVNPTGRDQRARKEGVIVWRGVGIVVVVFVLGALIFKLLFSDKASGKPAASAPPVVSVSEPLQRELTSRLQFLGQFSAVDQVELRAQVGGTLTRIGFKDGDLVKAGDVLFEIDQTQYQIKLSQATAQSERAQTQADKARAQVERARAQVEKERVRLELASRELTRAQTLQTTDAGTIQNVEQRSAEHQSAQAALNEAEATAREAEAAVRESTAVGHEADAMVRDARFDLDHCRITAPFSGRIGKHLVSVGNLISGNRGGGSSTTLLATLVSLSPIYLNFDMSESDYLSFQRERARQKGAAANKVEVSLSDEENFSRQGTLNFIDNTLDRSSGTIHARAVVPNANLLLTPGAFGRVRLDLTAPTQALLVPDASVIADQSDHMVLTVGSDDIVKPKAVQLGELRGGLRVIRSGLGLHDRVIIGGIVAAAPGAKVSPQPGKISFGTDQNRSSVQQ